MKRRVWDLQYGGTVPVLIPNGRHLCEVWKNGGWSIEKHVLRFHDAIDWFRGRVDTDAKLRIQSPPNEEGNRLVVISVNGKRGSRR